VIVVGLSPTAHESAVGVVVDGAIVAAASEERFTRVKNQDGFPHQALEFCLARAGVTAADVDHVAYAALPFATERRRDLRCFAANVAYVVGNGDSLTRRAAHLANYGRSLALTREWTSWGASERALRRELDARGLGGKLVFVDHHRAHCASAYYASGFDRALVVSLDGYGSGNAGAVHVGEHGRLRPVVSIPYPHSLGTFYRRVTTALGFTPNRHEGKVVGLAAYGDPARLGHDVLQRFDLSGPDHYRCRSGQDPYFARHLADRHPAEDVAAACQHALEHVAVTYVRRWLARTGTDRVACAGGVFANVKLNQRLVQLPEVAETFVFPAMGDSGVGVGAALALSADLGVPRADPLPTVFLGPDFTPDEVERAVRGSGLAFSRPADIDAAVAGLLAEGRVVARVSGRGEFGPRALGNRSILAPASDLAVTEHLNRRLRRSEFMPFAPATLDDAGAALYADVGKFRHAGRFMTVATDCLPAMRAASPACVHVDGTARPQLVTPAASPGLHRVLTEYRRRTGLASVLNTSFNIHEEPIVNSPDDAVQAFRTAGLDALALGDFLLEPPNGEGRR
jgi:carbamoyltransferase